MAMALSRLSQWLWPGSRARARELPTASLTSFPDFPSGFREPDSVKFPNAAAAGGGAGGRRARSHRIKRRRRSREEPRIDREYDMVIVPPDGGCLSGSESDDSDWSIGWLEPQAPELQSDADSEGSFAVLVPCYRQGQAEQPGAPKNRFLGPGNLADGALSDGKNFVEQWLSSLQN